MRTYSTFIALFMMALGLVGQELVARTPENKVKFKILDAWSGKPLKHFPVRFYEANGEVGSPFDTTQVMRELQARTDSQGVALFTLSEPLPRRLLVTMYVGRACRHAADNPTPNEFSPKQIISSGLVIQNDCVPNNRRGKLDQTQTTRKPGEIIYFVTLPSPFQL